MSNPTDRCARAGCGYPRQFHGPGYSTNSGCCDAFVDPATYRRPAADFEREEGARPAPQAESERVIRAVVYGPAQKVASATVTAPPDPDAAVRAIAEAALGRFRNDRIGLQKDQFLRSVIPAIAAGRALGRDEGAREASAGCYCKTRQFRVMDAPTGCPQLVPWWLLAPFEPQAKKNHEQSLERLNERGGLDPSEMLAVLEGRSFRRMDDAEAGQQLAKVVADAIARRGKAGG